MGNFKLTKDKSTSIISIVITVAAYASERLVEIFVQPTRTVAFVLVVGMTLALALVYLLLLKNKNVFYGLLAALIGYKMLPPTISMIAKMSIYGDMVYYLVRCLGSIIFLVLVIHYYKLQKGKDKIMSVPVLMIMWAVPFFTKIAEKSYYFLMIKTGNMLYYYFACFALYAIASMVILVVAYKSNYASMRFTSYFEFVALGINALKKIGSIIALSISHSHISKSVYCWIALYIILAICFYVAKEKKKKLEK